MSVPQLGDRVKCKVTGFKGIVVAITQWLNGCVRVSVKPEDLKDNKPQDAVGFDQEEVEVVDKGVVKPVVLEVKPAPEPPRSRTGGPDREHSGFARKD